MLIFKLAQELFFLILYNIFCCCKDNYVDMITYNIELKFETPQTEQFWLNQLILQRDCFNFISKLVFEIKPILALKIFHDKFYKLARKTFPDLSSQVVIKTEKEVLAMYKSARSNKHHIKTFIEKKNLSSRLDKRLYSNFNQNLIFLTSETPNKRKKAYLLNYPKSLEMFKNYTTHDPLIFYRDERFFLSVSFKIPEKPLQNEEVLGVDLGCRRLFTTSEGKSLLGNEFNYFKRKIRYNKKKLQSKIRKSHSARKKFKKLSHKERNFTKNYIHNVVNNLLKTDKGIIVLEDLTKIKEKTKQRKGSSHNNRISQIPFYLIKQILGYKAPILGKKLETVNPSYTSQTDCLTGRKSGNRVGCRFYTENNQVFDADWNASINIANKFSKHPVSHLPLDGGLCLIGRLLSFNQLSD